VLGKTSVDGQHLGILIIEFGVGLTVAAAMMLIFFAFISRGDNKI
jgi:multicomponent Na+:H+ antiporter subunit B